MTEDITQIQIDVLNYLRKHPKLYLSSAKLSSEFSLTTQKVDKIIRELENWGYVVLRNKTGDFRYGRSPDVLFPHEISFTLQTKVLGCKIFSFDRVGSTNVIANKYAEKSEPEGTVVFAERQIAGKGRLGRSWHSPAKRGIYMSIILQPKIPPSMAPGLSLIAALSVAESIRDYPGIKATIKWPNDVLYGNRKIAGVLTELSAELDRVKYVVVGIGVNANHGESDFPEELRTKAISLRMLTNNEIDRVKLIKILLTVLESNYGEFVSHGFKRLLKSIKRFSSVLGKEICFVRNGERYEGTAVDIDVNGRLVVDSGGKTISLSSGEISLTEEYER